MTHEELRIKELHDALNWIVFHLDHRPSLRHRLDLVTECERNSLHRVLEQPATECVKSQGELLLATGVEVALIGRLPRDPVSSEVESYIYAMRAEIERLGARVKELEAAERVETVVGSISRAAWDEHARGLARDCYQGPDPYDGETSLGIALDGGVGDDL